MWSSVFTGHCQGWIKCSKWRRVEDFCFIPYVHCCRCQSCWHSIATDSKESTGHSLFLFANPFSLHFGIDCHDSIGCSVLTIKKINTRGCWSKHGRYWILRGRRFFTKSQSENELLGENWSSQLSSGDEKTHAWSWALNWLMHFCVCVWSRLPCNLVIALPWFSHCFTFKACSELSNLFAFPQQYL